MSATTRIPGPGPSLGREVAEGTLFVSAFLLTIADAVATTVWLRAGVAIEGNPLLAGVVDSLGPEGAMLLRTVVGVSLLGALWSVRRRSRLAFPGLVLTTAVLVGVALIHLGIAVQSVLAGYW